CQHFWSTPWTF
nr:immunoglobulin light chain junction region [Mus musculus]NSL97083.1 immunoglobulin light chain junction region [Mus musculus]NSL97115.1 immunoglobulin light chain junction region [Mus musculus]NSL97202.1 immunoglobulin light chain junction region [Mus musculus]NSL97250.1 immunoglobulin light chain junction region [Mus musculus]